MKGKGVAEAFSETKSVVLDGDRDGLTGTDKFIIGVEDGLELLEVDRMGLTIREAEWIKGEVEDEELPKEVAIDSKIGMEGEKIMEIDGREVNDGDWVDEKLAFISEEWRVWDLERLAEIDPDENIGTDDGDTNWDSVLVLVWERKDVLEMEIEKVGIRVSVSEGVTVWVIVGKELTVRERVIDLVWDCDEVGVSVLELDKVGTAVDDLDLERERVIDVEGEIRLFKVPEGLAKVVRDSDMDLEGVIDLEGLLDKELDTEFERELEEKEIDIEMEIVIEVEMDWDLDEKDECGVTEGMGVIVFEIVDECVGVWDDVKLAVSECDFETEAVLVRLGVFESVLVGKGVDNGVLLGVESGVEVLVSVGEGNLDLDGGIVLEIDGEIVMLGDMEEDGVFGGVGVADIVWVWQAT